MTHSTPTPDASAIPFSTEQLAVLLPLASLLAPLSTPGGNASPAAFSAEQVAVLAPLMPILGEVAHTVIAFRSAPITPEATYQFEQTLQRLTRDLGRSAEENTLNSLEPDDKEELPPELTIGGTRYRLRRKSPTTVDGLFGRMKLHRWLYEPYESGERCLFPLEHLLGLAAGTATPALTDRVGRFTAQYTQRDALRLLKETTGLSWSHKLLRTVAKAASTIAADKRHDAQVKQVIAWLREAFRGRGPYEPVLAVGRDGVMMPIRGEKEYKEGAVATVAVYDRKGKRLGTVYLAWMPEALQETLSRQLTELLQGILAGWKGQRPRLAYITDGGSAPQTYYRKVLRKMTDPRRPGEVLGWVRAIDYYHAAQYISKMAAALFGEGKAAQGWAGRMRRRLKEVDGLKRVLQAASYYRNEQKLSGKRQEAFSKAYNYLWKRRRYMNYAGLRAKGLPIGSGVTEAGCKVVVNQRMKLSGMTWNRQDGQVVLNLRVVWLSGVWEQVWNAHLAEGVNMNSTSYAACLPSSLAIAA